MKRGEIMNELLSRYYNYSNPNNLFFSQWDNYFNKNAAQGIMNSCYCKKSFFRVLNTYINKLDVHLNEIVMAEKLNAGEFTRYVKLQPGRYQVKINESDSKNLIFESFIDIDQNLAYTGIITEDDRDKDDISILMIPEARENNSKGKMTGIRLINLASDAPKLELTASDGIRLFSGVDYGEVSNNVVVPSGRYNLSLQEKESKVKVKTMSIDFAPGMHYTLFVSGKYHENPDIQIIIPEDGVNYLELC